MRALCASSMPFTAASHARVTSAISASDTPYLSRIVENACTHPLGESTTPFLSLSVAYCEISANPSERAAFLRALKSSLDASGCATDPGVPHTSGALDCRSGCSLSRFPWYMATAAESWLLLASVRPLVLSFQSCWSSSRLLADCSLAASFCASISALLLSSALAIRSLAWSSSPLAFRLSSPSNVERSKRARSGSMRAISDQSGAGKRALCGPGALALSSSLVSPVRAFQASFATPPAIWPIVCGGLSAPEACAYSARRL